MLLLVVVALLFCGCAADRKKLVDSSDPWEDSNRTFHGWNDALDRTVLKPVAQTYADHVPDGVRHSVGNFFENLDYPRVMLNNYLQGNIGKGMADLSRFLFNTVFGLGGLFDVSTRMGLPKHQADMGQTLAKWGVRQGPYLEVPFSGPNTVRNLSESALSTAVNLAIPVGGLIFLPVTMLKVVDKRADLLDATRLRDEAAVDNYAFTREAFLQNRADLIYDGDPPLDDFESMLEEEEPGGVLIIE